MWKREKTPDEDTPGYTILDILSAGASDSFNTGGA
jgi:hypothetical protein